MTEPVGTLAKLQAEHHDEEQRYNAWVDVLGYEDERAKASLERLRVLERLIIEAREVPLYRLVGGPQDGKVAEAGVAASGGLAMLLSAPRPEGMFEEVVGDLEWNPNVEWYETRK